MPNEKPVNNPQKISKPINNKHSSKRIIILGIFLVIVLLLGYGYFFIISPTFVTKSEVPKPALSGDEPVGQGHVNYVVNEIGGYKLHNDLEGEEPEMEIVVEGSTFHVKNIDGVPKTSEGPGENPDIRLHATRAAFLQMYNVEDINTVVIDLYNDGELTIELLKDEATLALKGYKAIYDEISG